MYKTTINIDKLHYQFYLEENQLENILLKLSHLDYSVKENQRKDNSYRFEYSIFKDKLLIGTFHFYHFQNKCLCKFKFLNNLLYQFKDEVIELVENLENIEQFEKLNICSLEIALDTDQPLLKRYNRLLKQEKIKLNKNYISEYFGVEYEDNEYIRDILKETKYIRSKKTSFSKTINNELFLISKLIFFRLENKKALLDLDLSDKRFYIKDYLEQNGIDTTKNHFRFELVVPNLASFHVSNNIVYYNNEGAYISKYEYDKAFKIVSSYSQSSIFSPVPKNYLKSKFVIDEYCDKRTLRSSFDIGINSLFDKDYLYSLFFAINDSKKIIYSIDSIIDVNYKNKKIIMKKEQLEKREKRVKKSKVEDDLELQCYSYLHRIGRLTDEDYNKIMSDFNNNSIVGDKLDLFDLNID